MAFLSKTIASANAVSPAATQIMKIPNILPDNIPKKLSTVISLKTDELKLYLLNATTDKTTELKINSNDINVITIFFLVNNPKIPIESKADENINIISRVI